MERAQTLLQQALELLQPYPPLQALLTVLLFLLLARFGNWLIDRLLRRLVQRTRNRFDDRLLDLLHRPVFASIALFGLALAVLQLSLSERLETLNLNIIKTIAIWVWLVFGLRFARLAIELLSRRERASVFLQPSTRPLLSNALAILIVVAGAYAIFEAWDIDVTGLVASAGIVGLALSFAAQDTLSNLFAGIAILADRPYKLGDYIILDSGERGEVTQIGLRSTRLLTRDDVEITIPNSVMGNAKIINEAGGPVHRYRIRVPVGVAYGSDIDQVMQLLLDVAAAHGDITAEPAARVRLRGFGDSSLNFELLAWIRDPADRGRVQHELNCAIYKAFAAAGVEIPFPQRDLHIRQMPGQPPAAGQP